MALLSHCPSQTTRRLLKVKGLMLDPTYASRDEKREETATQPPLLLLQAFAGF